MIILVFHEYKDIPWLEEVCVPLVSIVTIVTIVTIATIVTILSIVSIITQSLLMTGSKWVQRFSL